MEREELFNRLQFHHNPIIGENIDAIAGFDQHTLVCDRHELLANMGNLTQRQFMGIGTFVSGFEQPRPKFPMNLDASTDEFVGKFVDGVNGHGSFATSASFALKNQAVAVRFETNLPREMPNWMQSPRPIMMQAK